MAALRPENRNAGQAGRPAMRQDRDAGDAEAPRRRVEEPEPGERGDAGGGGGRRKGPGRRPAAPVGQGEDPVDRPVGAGVSGRPGRSPLPRAGTGTAGSRPCPEPTSRRRRSAGSGPGMGSWRTRPNGAGTVPTGARRLPRPATSPAAISRLGCRTGNGPRTSPGIRAGDGKGVPLAAGRLPRRQDRRVHGRPRSRCRARRRDARQGRGITAGGSASPGALRPRPPPPVARMAGSHEPLRPGAADGRQRPFPGRRRGGALRTHEDGIRPSRASGGAYPRRGARPDQRLHPLARPRAHQTAARLDEPGTIPSKPRNGCAITSKKTSAAPPTRRRRAGSSDRCNTWPTAKRVR